MEAQQQLFIGGEWVAPSTSEVIEVVSPHTEQVFATAVAAGPADVDKAVAAARRAFDEGPWPRMAPAERIAAVRRIADLYAPQRGAIASTVTAEMGAPSRDAKMAHATIPWMFMKAFADLAEQHPWEVTRKGAYGVDIMVRREAVGVVAAIVPWNMPNFMLIAKLIPALLAGCPVILKPSPETPLDANMLAEIVRQAELPEGLVSVLPGGRELGQYLVAHPGVDKVSFTGSTAAGRNVAAVCGGALRRVSLELGGKSAAIVLDDADPAFVAEGTKISGLMNSGQACVAQTRILVPRSRYGEFVDALADMMSTIPVGNPEDPTTEVGPMVAQRQQARVRGYIDIGQKEGARMVVGGTDLPNTVDSGWYVRPTLFADVRNDMTIAREEIFGPVLSVIPYDGDAEAVRIANDSEYGLAGSVWTSDPDRGLAVAKEVRAGTYGINGAYPMDPMFPMGGFKASGIGRELGSEGIESFLETKSISGMRVPS